MQTLSKVVVGRIVDYIWGCRTCYSTFLSEEELDLHRDRVHHGLDTPGECWIPEQENYRCPHCNQVQNSRHLIWFIYHVKKCAVVVPSSKTIKREMTEEEETDNELQLETCHDYEGIVLHLLKVSGILYTFYRNHFPPPHRW